MSFFDWLRCPVHDWERVDVLKDRPKNPTAVTIISACRACGKVKQETVKAPLGNVPPAPVCPPHKWKLVESVLVYPKGTKKGDEETIPMSRLEIMQCDLCGERKDRKVQA